jgi:hypothetical protein
VLVERQAHSTKVRCLLEMGNGPNVQRESHTWQSSCAVQEGASNICVTRSALSFTNRCNPVRTPVESFAYAAAGSAPRDRLDIF